MKLRNIMLMTNIFFSLCGCAGEQTLPEDYVIVKSRLRFHEILRKDVFSQDSIKFAAQTGFFIPRIELRNIVVKNGWIELVGINGSLTLYPDNMCIVRLERENNISFITKKDQMGIRELSYLDLDINMFPPDVGTINPFPEITCRSDKELLAWREYLKQEKIDFNSRIKFEVKKIKKYTIVKIKLVKSSDFIGYGELWVRENFLK